MKFVINSFTKTGYLESDYKLIAVILNKLISIGSIIVYPNMIYQDLTHTGSESVAEAVYTFLQALEKINYDEVEELADTFNIIYKDVSL